VVGVGVGEEGMESSRCGHCAMSVACSVGT